MGGRSCLADAVKYLALRSRCESEVVAHLKKKGHEEVEIADSIEKLKGEGLIDDEGSAAMWASQLAATGKMGKDAAIRKLIARGLPVRIAKQASETAWRDRDETEDALLLLEKILPSASDDDGEGKLASKAARYLGSRGFSSEAVAKALRRLGRG